MTSLPIDAVVRAFPVDAPTAWTLVADLRNHERWIPLTRISVDGGRVTAVSGLLARRGAPGLKDVMTIDRFDPPVGTEPGVAAFTKVGRVLRGTASIVVVPAGPSSSRVLWTEDVYLAGPLPRRLTGAVLRPFLGAMTRYALMRAQNEARATHRHG
ncbi:SRPBCC family protein [Cellulomonas fengjieae]|uniref:SRPBCC family protein n=1 Tax=Cellulomonas fengjieae TaxID=2819978 RepID=A0ABS3SLK9_9CELL|nr:SRPBCC family protein [Cellulomonas fengjieae]MBO3086640.1 SRPBCC family protein [Cellulomonas fengjieae]MBO3100632.1 SRPBCC family protein [Cellulomonas fengjieae]QVI66511.1 SRPBCC family protein [Cellulomonas fengjieae]